MTRHDVDAVRRAVDLLSIVGETVQLRRSGRSYKGLCPFHDEKTPSFHVFPDSQRFKCFGCGLGGDLFTYMMAQKNISFSEAMLELAERASIGIDGRERRQRQPVRIVRFSPQESLRDWTELVEARHAKTPRGRLCAVAIALGVGTLALDQLRVFWSPRHGAYGWPMRDATGCVIGVRLRSLAGGRKWAVPGSREGLFLAGDLLADGPLLLVEGASDTAAALDLGLAVVGRPSATGGVRYCAALARGREVVVVADADDAGRHGAEALASVLMVHARSVRVIEPPAPSKDLRAWVEAGATRGDVLALIQVVSVRRLRIRSASEVTAT